MITPEPEFERMHYVDDGWLAYMDFPTRAAAGHLGVIEEECTGTHEVLDLIAIAGAQGPCPACGAAV